MTTENPNPSQVAPQMSAASALIGDPSKAEKAFGWKATTHWKELAELMVDADIAAIK